MADTPDAISCLGSAEEGNELLPLNPYYALSYHFGMLLGVDDFETEQAYHRGKMRLHNAWLHRQGVVWGLDVQLDTTRGEVRVLPGLALDAAGHELHLEADACVNVGEWFKAHREDPDLEIEDLEDGGKGFDAHVVIRFKACLTRQVPALSEPCNGGGGGGTAYSRVFETVELLLRPGLAPVAVYPYHRLRLLFALDPPVEEEGAIVAGDQEVLDARAAILALPSEDQPAAYLEAFRRFAAFDQIDLRPATSEDGNRMLLFPGDERTPVVLANLEDLVVAEQDDKWVLVGGNVDVTVRPSHVATSTIQELLCGPLFQLLAAPPPEDEEGDAEGEGGDEVEEVEGLNGEDAGGPRIYTDSVEATTMSIKCHLSAALLAETVTPEAVSVSWLDAEGWHVSQINEVNYWSEDLSITINLASAIAGKLRLIVRGTGATPMLGADGVPLAGAVGGAPGTAHDGHDFVFMTDIIQEPVEVEEY